MESKLIKVSSQTDIMRLCSSITSVHSENSKQHIIIRSVGAGALNQAIKGVILSNRHFAKIGLKASLTPYFKDLVIESGETISSIEMSLQLLPL